MNRIHLRQFVAIFIFFLVLIACQEEVMIEEIVQPDEDIATATALANEFLRDAGARSDAKKSIVVLKYKKGKLLYATTRDNYKSYQELEEHSVTALAGPGDYVFWYSGGGITDLEGVEFDSQSQVFLDNLPDEINADKMWVIQVPSSYDTSHEFLKYDIVYDYKGNKGAPVRLDPKLQIEN